MNPICYIYTYLLILLALFSISCQPVESKGKFFSFLCCASEPKENTSGFYTTFKDLNIDYRTYDWTGFYPKENVVTLESGSFNLAKEAKFITNYHTNTGVFIPYPKQK